MDFDPFPTPPQSFWLPGRYLVQIALVVVALLLPALMAQLY